MCSADGEILRTEVKCSGGDFALGSYSYAWYSCMS